MQNLSILFFLTGAGNGQLVRRSAHSRRLDSERVVFGRALEAGSVNGDTGTRTGGFGCDTQGDVILGERWFLRVYGHDVFLSRRRRESNRGAVDLTDACRLIVESEAEANLCRYAEAFIRLD
ncbi:hypothetical protein [Amycolatopsis balhimycina]|uniref:hypothetical protein n=1 Tax=Amycolatopsis balhimycina TaxID=208443 RepID=UPI000F77BDA8|nr:hypothetical protein [Amycolatopsis balhimycina]